jgi:hypothetical protein
MHLSVAVLPVLTAIAFAAPSTQVQDGDTCIVTDPDAYYTCIIQAVLDINATTTIEIFTAKVVECRPNSINIVSTL